MQFVLRYDLLKNESQKKREYLDQPETRDISENLTVFGAVVMAKANKHR